MPEGRPPARRRRRALLIGGGVLALLVVVYLARDAIVLSLLRPGLASSLRNRLGVDATWQSLDAHVPADLSRLTLTLRGLSLRAHQPPAALSEADLAQVEVEFGLGALLAGGMVPRKLWLEGGRFVLDLRDAGPPGGWPEELPVMGSSHLAARVLLPGDRTLHADDFELGVDPAPAAPALQSWRLGAAALRLAQGEEVRELGALQAQLGWRGGQVTVANAELQPPAGGRVELLAGTVLELANPAGPRLRGKLQALDVHLDALALGDVSPPRADLTLKASFDAPLRAEDGHAWLAAAEADLDLRLMRPGTVDSLQLRGRLQDGTLAIEDGTVSTSGGRAELLSGRLVLGRGWADSQLVLEARADLADLAPAGALLAPLLDDVPPGNAERSWGGALQGRVSVSGALAEPAFDVDLAGADVRVVGWRLGDVRLRATGDQRLAQIQALELRQPHGTLSARGALALPSLVLHDAHASIAVRGAGGPAPDVLGQLLQLLLPGAEGEVELDVEAEGPLRAPRLVLHGCAPELRVQGVVVREAWLAAEVVEDRLLVSAARADVNGTQVLARGELRGWPGLSPRWLARAEAFRLEREGAVLQLLEPVSFGWDGRPQLSPLDLAGSSGLVHAELLDAGAGGDAHVLDVRVRQVRLPAVLLPEGVRLQALDLDLHLAWREGVAASRGLLAWLAASHDLVLEAEARASGLDIDAAGAHATELVLRADLAGEPSAPRGQLLLGAEGLRAALPAGIANVLAGLRATGEVQTAAIQPGQVVFVGQAGRVSAAAAEHEVPPDQRAFGPCSVGARLELGNEVRLADFDARDSTGWQLEADGMLGAPCDLRSLLSGGRPVPAGADVRGVATLRAGDLVALRDWLGDVRRLTGALSVDGGVSGTLAAPKLVGRVHLVDGALLLGVGLPALEALAVELELDPREVRIVRFKGESGAAPFELEGRARLDGRDDALDLRFAGQDLLVWRGQGVKVRADVDVALSGSVRSPLAKGRITLRDTRITRNLNALQLSRAPGEGPVRLLPPAFEEGTLSTLRLDLELDARDPVQLENNIVLGACVPDLHFGGTGREPVLTGLIVIKPSRVALPGSVVQLTGGTLTFAAGEPGRPTVDLAGEARVRSWDVTLGVKGPFDEPQLELSSRPPLPSEDVLLLLLTGQPPAGVRAPGPGDSGPVAVYLGQDLLARWLTESPDPDAGLVQRFDVTYAEDVTTRGSTSLQVSYRLEGEGGAGRTLYLQAEKDPYDAVNFGLRWRVRLP